MQRLNDEIKMIALDIDGTTLNSSSELSSRTKKTLEEATKNNIEVVFSTGRSYNSLPEEIKSINGINYVITSNGAHINKISTGETIYNSYLNPNVIKDVIYLKNIYDFGIEVFIDGQAYIDRFTYDDVVKNGCEFRNAKYILWSRKPIDDISKLMEDNRECIENINICFTSAEQFETLKDKIYQIPNASFTSSFKNSIEVGGPNTSKRTALEVLLNKLNINSKNLMCGGDAPNDIQMIEFAGVGVAVGNAWEETKNSADYIAASNDEDGIAQFIEKYVLNK